ncbi:MAG: DJ-1/PfpI family protein [Opitutaceae bacterium]|nr:DJ-1/PfpI family protein [Opitutaceae bacterium]
MPPRLTVGAVLFDGFELLDAFGPLGILGILRDRLRILTLAEHVSPVASSAGPRIAIDRAFETSGPIDILLVPGGPGTRREIHNTLLIAWLQRAAAFTPHVATVCTGSALLARTGLLDGRRATTNKRAFHWVASQGPHVVWQPEARWVEDGKFFTASGVAAGIDMSLGLVATLFGRETAISVATRAEHDWHEDKSWDPFARINGLVA